MHAGCSCRRGVEGLRGQTVRIDDDHLKPRILMSPFGNVAFSDWPSVGPAPVAESAALAEIVSLAGHPQSEEAVLTRNGRGALALALEALAIGPADEVVIHTTSGGPYISRCVTETIERYGSWARNLSARTKAIVLIHEFGFPAKLPDEFVQSELPVINDCAYALGVANAVQATRKDIRDYTIFSFSKAFPVPYGGALVGKAGSGVRSTLSPEKSQLLLGLLLERYLPSLAEAHRKRKQVWAWYQAAFSKHDISPRLLSDLADAVPHAFLANIDDEASLIPVREEMNRQFIESSVYFGRRAYFFPCHQSMGFHSVSYVVDTFIDALERCGSGTSVRRS